MESRFKEIFFKYHPKVFRVAYYVLKNAQAAEDVSQEVFLKFWSKQSQWDTIDSIEAYLVRMARNLSLDELTSIKKEQENIISLRYDQQMMTPAQRNDQEDLKAKLEKAVSNLSPQCRLIFSLSRFEGMTNDEIATQLRISKRTVETQISIALRRFRTDLKHFLLSAALLVVLFLSL